MARVLIIRLSSFGDVAMLVPVIHSVAAAYPQDRFTVLTRTAYAGLFENLGFNVSVIHFHPSKYNGPLGLIKLLMRLNRSRFTYIADMHDVLRSKIIRANLWIKVNKIATIDKGRTEKKEFLRKKLNSSLQPTINRYFDVFNRLGFPAQQSFINLFEYSKPAFHLLSPFVSTKEGYWVGIAPFAKHTTKIYPLKRMEKVVAQLSDLGYNIFLFGSGDQEEAILEGWQRKYTNVKSAAGKFSLMNEMLFLSYLDVMVTMDSANMHLASLVEVPVVSIWGATNPNMGFYGYRQDPNNAIRVNIECNPCSVYGEIPCARGDMACMNGIDESTIVNKVAEILKKKAGQ